MQSDPYGRPLPPPAPAPRRRSMWGIFVAITIVGLLGIAVIAALVAVAGETGGVADRIAKDRIGVITVAGIISASAQPGMFGGTSGAGAEQLVEQIREAADDDSIKAVVVRINSPGGAAASSQEVFEALMTARETSRKPFVASMADIAASGGYYIAAGCEKIVALRATATGSIGVVMPGYDISGFLDWIHIEPEVIKSGKFKDIGSMDRPMTAEERQLLQQLVDTTYQQFLTDVAAGRQMKVAAIRPYADGRIFTGEQALKYGLVDQLGGFYDAVTVAQELAHVSTEGEPNLHYYGSGTIWEELLGAQSVLPRGPQLPLPGWAASGGLAPVWFLAPVQFPLTDAGAGS